VLTCSSDTTSDEEIGLVLEFNRYQEKMAEAPKLQLCTLGRQNVTIDLTEQNPMHRQYPKG
jgi:hypothetical protein